MAEQRHVIKDGDDWVVRKPGAGRAHVSALSEADPHAAEILRNTGGERIAHGVDGKIRSKGHDRSGQRSESAEGQRATSTKAWRSENGARFNAEALPSSHSGQRAGFEAPPRAGLFSTAIWHGLGDSGWDTLDLGLGGRS
jgi:hypothetical protein